MFSSHLGHLGGRGASAGGCWRRVLIDITLGFIGSGLRRSVLGGFGSIPGALVGGVTIGIIGFSSGAICPTASVRRRYVVLLLVLAIRPQGMFGTVGRKKV